MVLKRHNDGAGMLIGLDRETGEKVYYYGERGLATIAAPGSGKTQGHILPNLMTWPGPMIVLDVTGELWRRTSKRRSTFGPVYKFDVEETATSDHYNPFDMIRADPRHAWGDAASFAGLLYSRAPSGAETAGGNFFDQAVPAYIAAFATFIALKEPRYRRNCETLLRYVSAASFEGFLEYAKESGLLGLEAAAATLAQADPETRANVLWTAKNSLGPWEQPDIAELTRISDWRPDTIRGHNATLYICASVDHLRKHPGLIRVLLGQHVQALTADRHFDRDRNPWVQLIVDEAPQLRRLDVLRSAIEIGRNHNLRCWLIMQWRGQLIEAYGRDIGEGMIGVCGMQAYMNPSMEDGMADVLSRRIGERVHPADGTRRPIMTPQAVAGHDHAGEVFVWDEGHVRLRKHFYVDDAELRNYEGAAP